MENTKTSSKHTVKLSSGIMQPDFFIPFKISRSLETPARINISWPLLYPEYKGSNNATVCLVKNVWISIVYIVSNGCFPCCVFQMETFCHYLHNISNSVNNRVVISWHILYRWAGSWQSLLKYIINKLF